MIVFRSTVIVLAAVFLLRGGGPAQAAEHPANGNASLGYIDLTSTALPVIWQGRLVNYVFVKLRLKLAPGRKSLDYHAQQPYLRDALVRDAHRTPFVRPGDFIHLDEAALKRTLLTEAARVMGTGVVVDVSFTSQTPARISGFPSRSPSARSPTP